jgi:hypothetical protein
MKNNFFYLIILLFSSTNIFAQDKNEKTLDSINVVHVVGVAVEKESPIDGAIIRLMGLLLPSHYF